MFLNRISNSFTTIAKQLSSRSAIGICLLFILANIFNALAPIVIARNWGASDFGIFSAFWGIVGMIGMVFLGVQTTVAGNLEGSGVISTRNLKISLDSYTKFVLSGSLLISIVISILNLRYPTLILGGSNTLLLIGISIFSTCLAAISFGKLIAQKKFLAFYLAGFIFSLSKILTVAIFAFFNLTVNSTLIALVFEQLALGITLFLLTNNLGHVTFGFFQRSSLFPYIFSSITWIMLLSDVLFIRFHLNSTDAGLFSMGSNLIKFVLIPISLITNYSLAKFSQAPVILNLRSQSIRNLTSLVTGIIILGFVLLQLAGRPIFEMVYGIEYDLPPFFLPVMLISFSPYIYLLLLSTLILNKLDSKDIVVLSLFLSSSTLILINFNFTIYSFLTVYGLLGMFLLIFFELRIRSVRN